MHIVRASILSLMLFPAACSKSNDVYEPLPDNMVAGVPRTEMTESRMESTLVRPVTIGEDGPRLDACGGIGRVTRAGTAGLPVRAAPFADAREIARLPDGGHAFICTRSLDQKWLGIVMPPQPAADNAVQPVDCGVSGPVDRKQTYDGPCVSGWVASAYVQQVAG